VSHISAARLGQHSVAKPNAAVFVTHDLGSDIHKRLLLGFNHIPRSIPAMYQN
jgi:hypothetical protein